MKKNAWKIILAIAVLVCIVCLGRFGWIKYQDHKTEQARKETLKAIARTEFTGENDGDEPEKVPAGVKHGQKVDFKKLIKINSDIYAWIYVPGTRIDYPVAQNQEDDTHYLKYNFKNEPEFAGCIYTEKANKKDFYIESNKLVDYLGGKDNIIAMEVNMSRFKVTLNDVSKVNKEAIQKMGAKGIVEIDNQLKIILGPNAKTLLKYIEELKK